MRPLLRLHLFIIWLVALAAGAPAALAQQAQPDHVAAIKQSLAESEARLRQYEWLETIAVSLKGEEKSRQLNRCSYGADGAVQKTVLMAPAPQKKKPGLRGAIAEHKKEELTGYMQQAVALVKQYLPPNPKRIQAAKEAGKVSVALLGSGQRVRVDIRDYALAGDTLGIEADLATNRLLGLKVSTYQENPKDAVSLNAQFASLPDGTTYLHQALLDATAKKVQVAVGKSDYRRKSN